MKSPIEYVRGTGFPKDIRETVNDLVEAYNRVEEIKVAPDLATAGKIIETDLKKVYLVPLSTGTSGTTKPFQLIAASTNSVAKVRIVISSITGIIPPGFSPGDKPPYVLTVADGNKVYGVITYDVSGEAPGDILSVDIGAAATVPEDDTTNGIFYRLIGTVAVDGVKVTPVNTLYGPMESTAFRVWFSDPKTFGVAWQGAGDTI